MTKKEQTPRKRRGSNVPPTSTPEGEQHRQTAAPTRRKRTPDVARSHNLTFTDEHVRVHAYYLYLQRGGRPGDPLEDWLRAEREIGSAIGRS